MGLSEGEGLNREAWVNGHEESQVQGLIVESLHGCVQGSMGACARRCVRQSGW